MKIEKLPAAKDQQLHKRRQNMEQGRKGQGPRQQAVQYPEKMSWVGLVQSARQGHRDEEGLRSSQGARSAWPGIRMRARDGSLVSHSDHKASPGHEDDLRPSQHAQLMGEDLGQTGHCLAQQLWLGQAMGAWAELRDSTQDKANRPLLFSRFTQLCL